MLDPAASLLIGTVVPVSRLASVSTQGFILPTHVSAAPVSSRSAYIVVEDPIPSSTTPYIISS
jgi:hypothetical protein